MDTAQATAQLVYYVIGICSFAAVAVAWLIRLEAKVSRANEKIDALEIKQAEDIAKVETRADALENKVMDKLSIIEKSLARIEGRLAIETN